jgi:ATP-dependent helicase/DNAse subunit B
MSPKVTRLSATRISTYEQCPKYYDFEYVTRERRAFTPVEWEVGSIVHKALAQLFEQVRDRHRATVPKIGNAAWHKPVVERLAETLRQSVQSGEVRIIRQEVQLEHYLQQIDSAIAKFNTKVLPSLVEHKVAGIEADLGKYTLAGVEIVGRIDLVTMQGANVYVHEDGKAAKRGRAPGKALLLRMPREVQPVADNLPPLSFAGGRGYHRDLCVPSGCKGKARGRA